jgi:hypothetical protein
MRASSSTCTAMLASRTLAIAAAAMLAVGAAHATTLSTGKPADPSASATGLATRDQLRDCMMTEASLKQRFQALEVSTAAHEKMVKQVEAEGDRIAELHANLDHDSPTAVKAYNGLVEEHNRHVGELNKHAHDSLPASHAYNDDMAAFNHRCSSLHYSVDDMEAVMAERQKAAAAH